PHVSARIDEQEAITMRVTVAIAIVSVAVGIAAAVVPVDVPRSPFAVVHAQGGAKPSDTVKQPGPTNQPDKTPSSPSSPSFWDSIASYDGWLLVGTTLVAVFIVVGGTIFLFKDPLEMTPLFFFWLGTTYTGLLL